MRVIVPGGYYSYDSAGKKIWLDYQYYGTTLENIERVKNLTRNKILYDCKLSKEPVTVSNGCITHSYQGTEADTDKIQAQKRANDMADKAILRSLITALNQTVGIDFEGTVEIPQE